MRTLLSLLLLTVTLSAQERVTITRPDGTRIVSEPVPPQRAMPMYRPVMVQAAPTVQYYAAPAVAVERRPATPIRSAIRALFGRN